MSDALQDLTRPVPASVSLRRASTAARARRGRVHWNADERARLVRAAAGLLSAMQARSRLDALRQAQLAVLPPERRRRVAAVTGLTWYLDGLAAETARLQQRLDGRVPAPVASDDAPEERSSLADLVALAAPLLRRAAVDLLSDAVEAALCRVLRTLPPQGLLARSRRAGPRTAR
jgi:hypothetical protein